jgi:hypothetical protein
MLASWSRRVSPDPKPNQSGEMLRSYCVRNTYRSVVDTPALRAWSARAVQIHLSSTVCRAASPERLSERASLLPDERLAPAVSR